MMLPDVSLLLASFQSLGLDATGALRSNKSGSHKVRTAHSSPPNFHHQLLDLALADPLPPSAPAHPSLPPLLPVAQGVDLDGKKCSQSATSSPCQPYRSAVTIQRHHSYDRITSSTNHYAKHFPTYSPPPSYRNTLLSASSATAPPFYPEPGPSTYHYGGTRPNQFRMPSARKSTSPAPAYTAFCPASWQHIRSCSRVLWRAAWLNASSSC